MLPSQSDFVRQQGYDATHPPALFSALMFQPRVVGVLLLAGMATHSARLFLALGVALLWAAVLPEQNPFNWAYDLAVARPRRLPRIGPAPPPRRFAMGLAGAMALGISASIVANVPLAEWTLEGLLLLAVLAIVIARFCFGSFVFGLLVRWLPADRRPRAVCWIP